MYFDNSDGLLASPFSEVVVTRRAFRSGESEYSINKTPARLRDIRELSVTQASARTDIPSSDRAA